MASSREWLAGPNFRMIKRGADGKGHLGKESSNQKTPGFHRVVIGNIGFNHKTLCLGQNPLEQMRAQADQGKEVVVKRRGEFKLRKRHT